MLSMIMILLKLTFFLMGLVFVFTGLRLRIRYLRLKRRGATTVGEVKELVASNHFDGLILHFPVVEIITVTGKTVRFRSSLGSSLQEYRIGDQVPVVYDLKNPEKAEIQAASKFDKHSFVFLIVGFLFLITSGIMTYLL